MLMPSSGKVSSIFFIFVASSSLLLLLLREWRHLSIYAMLVPEKFTRPSMVVDRSTWKRASRPKQIYRCRTLCWSLSACQSGTILVPTNFKKDTFIEPKIFTWNNLNNDKGTSLYCLKVRRASVGNFVLADPAREHGCSKVRNLGHSAGVVDRGRKQHILWFDIPVHDSLTATENIIPTNTKKDEEHYDLCK